MKRSKHRRGLTLLELMIVLIILVGLIALVGPRLLLGCASIARLAREHHARIGAIECADVPSRFKLIDDSRCTGIANSESALQE